MAKVEKSKVSRKIKKDIPFPLGRTNYLIMAIGLVVIVIGYIMLADATVNGFAQMTFAPILLVLGYCVIIPIGIMYRKKDKAPAAPVAPEIPPAG